MSWRKARILGITALATNALGGCDSYPDYRYRMTVEVDTPHGIKIGSSVIEVRTKGILSMQSSTGRSFRSTVHGEAVAIDLGAGRTLFGLLEKPNSHQYAQSVAFLALKPVRDPGIAPDDYAGFLKSMVSVAGAHDLPKNHWPLFVYFTNAAEPSSIREANPAALPELFGRGSRVRRVAIELTTDKVTRGIVNRFEWWDQYSNLQLDGHRLNDSSVLANNLNRSAFKRD